MRHGWLCLGLALVGAGCAEDGPEAGVRVVAARDLGPLGVSSGVRGRDGGYSGLFEGRSVWLYGDTTLDSPNERGQTWLHDSWSWTEDLDASDGIGVFRERPDRAGAPTEFFPWTAEERAFNAAHFEQPCQSEPCGARWALWPGSLVADPERGRALIFYGKIYAEPGDFNFRGVGQSIAVWHAFERSPERPELRPGTAEPTLLFGEADPPFGSAALAEGGLLYAYACQSGDGGKPCRLGRVPLAEALDRGAWRFYAGEAGWVPELIRARSVFSGNDILSVSFAPGPGLFLAVYSEPLGRGVKLRTASRPEGPWSREVEAFEAIAPEGDGWIYDAQAHAEYAISGGFEQFITYSRATGFFASEMRLVRLTLERHDASSNKKNSWGVQRANGPLPGAGGARLPRFDRPPPQGAALHPPGP